MDDTRLTIHCSGSIFRTPFDGLRRWRTLLDCADAIGVERDGGGEVVRVGLGGFRRWIAFERLVCGSPLCAVGYQETVGAEYVGDGRIIGGSNRKVIAWVYPGGRVEVE